ncbi:hypothetical protein PYJP_11320 [Pyrofollis japonicus]|uniref:DUF998 domain-containing protein n=1 Tax=Pyrofollis japonicus TaxID=3060460 RepID=UPI00295A5EF8|nr:DUF998 domain-containing protein [Pyrofollis japonicus]BEP17780.1 hypothetical protein PYJP_11320 [Pyrofollis japonicus]
MHRECVSLFALALIVPLTAIFVAIAVSPWFSFWNNALSDLGHQEKHPASAKIFNAGLGLGAIILALLACKCLRGICNALVVAAAASLVLVAVYNEAYGKIHFWVSVLFFLSLLSLVIAKLYLGPTRRIRIYSAITATIYVLIWYLHFVEETPPGAAIPELTSVTLYAPLLLDCLKRPSP